MLPLTPPPLPQFRNASIPSPVPGNLRISFIISTHVYKLTVAIRFPIHYNKNTFIRQVLIYTAHKSKIGFAGPAQSQLR
jgi:hypothetical protein